LVLIEQLEQREYVKAVAA